MEETSCRAPGMATASCKSRWFGVRLRPVGPQQGNRGTGSRVQAALSLIFAVSHSASPQAVSWCRGYAFLEQQQPTVELSCEKMPVAVRRCPHRTPLALLLSPSAVGHVPAGVTQTPSPSPRGLTPLLLLPARPDPEIRRQEPFWQDQGAFQGLLPVQQDLDP